MRPGHGQAWLRFGFARAPKGKRLPVREIHGDVATLSVSDLTTLAGAACDEVWLDNSNFLAAEFYRRHQVPGPEYPAYNSTTQSPAMNVQQLPGSRLRPMSHEIGREPDHGGCCNPLLRNRSQ